MMRELSKAELHSISGGVVAEVLGITGVEEGLAVAGVGGAVGLAWGIGYGIGTGIYALYNWVRY